MPTDRKLLTKTTNNTSNTISAELPPLMDETSLGKPRMSVKVRDSIPGNAQF